MYFGIFSIAYVYFVVVFEDEEAKLWCFANFYLDINLH